MFIFAQFYLLCHFLLVQTMRAAVINAMAVAIRQHYGIQQQALSVCNYVRINLPVQKKKIENILLAISHHPAFPKLTNRPGFSGTVPVLDTLSRNPERCLRDAKMSRFGFRSPGWDRRLSK